MKQFLKKFCGTIFLTISLSIVHAQDGTPIWTNIYNGSVNGNDEASAIALDAGGNVYVTGSVFTNRSAYDTDYATIKYSPSGAILWINFFNGAGNSTDVAEAMAVDANSNVIVTGYSVGNSSSEDYATIKYSTDGVALWTNIFNGAGNGEDMAKAIAVDATGSIHVTGYVTGNGSGKDLATIKYSANGIPLWTNIFNRAGSGDDVANAIALDGSSNVYVTGYSTRPNSIFDDYDYTTIKYSTSGIPLWTNFFGSTNGDSAPAAIKLDANGNVYVAGGTQFGSLYAFATLKYSSAGMPLWTNYFNILGNGSGSATALGVDASGNTYVTGTAQISRPNYSYVTIKYSTDGVALWTNFLNVGVTNIFQSTALALDGSGNVYVTGGPADNYIYSNNFVNYATVKYSTDGVVLWTNLFVGTGKNFGQAFAIAVDTNGNAYVTGDATDNGSGRDFVTIKYAAPPTPLFFITTSGGFGAMNNQFTLKLTGPASSNAIIFAGTNLLNWAPLTTNQLSGGSFQFTDKLATNFLQRFYRARLQ